MSRMRHVPSGDRIALRTSLSTMAIRSHVGLRVISRCSQIESSLRGIERGYGVRVPQQLSGLL